METKKDLKLEKFVEGVDNLGKELMIESRGYMMVAYGETENNMVSAFSSKGKLGNLAECIYACMKQDPMFANLIIAASNAIVQSRMAEAGMSMAQSATEEPKKKRNKKKVS